MQSRYRYCCLDVRNNIGNQLSKKKYNKKGCEIMASKPHYTPEQLDAEEDRLWKQYTRSKLNPPGPRGVSRVKLIRSEAKRNLEKQYENSKSSNKKSSTKSTAKSSSKKSGSKSSKQVDGYLLKKTKEYIRVSLLVQ